MAVSTQARGLAQLQMSNVNRSAIVFLYAGDPEPGPHNGDNVKQLTGAGIKTKRLTFRLNALVRCALADFFARNSADPKETVL